MTAIPQRSFAGGELTPSLYARVDINKYNFGLRQLRNFMVMRHGGATNRPGTVFIGEVKDSSKTIRFIPFIFNSDQTYVLEFGDLYMRIFRQGGRVIATDIAPWNIATPYEIGDMVTLLGYNWYC